MRIQLQASRAALEKLVKRIQVLRERGDARPLDSVQAKYALDLIRAISTRHEGRTPSKKSKPKTSRTAKVKPEY
jgi:hypothetical protein